MRIYIWILIIILLYVYISYYYRYPQKVKVLNAYTNQFNNSLLFEKQPIVLLDNIYSTLKIAKSYINPYSFHKEIVHIPLVWNTNRSKYLFIRCDKETELHLLPSSKKLYNGQPMADETLITIQIKPSQLIIIPFHWHFYSSINLDILGMNDFISWIL
jgi:hypothetical protein